MLARAAIVFALGLLGVALIPGLGGCGRPLEPANRPLDGCARTCTARVSAHCSESECYRGCELILDRILEKESDNVIACIGRTSRRCSDVVWADCATRIGVHADGGPPEAPPLTEDE